MQTKKYDVFNAACPSHKLLDIIGSKWIILLLHKLAQKTYRFGGLKKEMSGISKKVLTHSLRVLEENGLVQRQVFDEQVLRVEYSLTPIGLSLSNQCRLLTEWAEKNMEEIERYRKR